MNAIETQKWLSMTRLVEEVPGVPSEEQYFIRHERKTVWRGPSKQAGESWAKSQGIVIELFEPFDP